MLVSTVRPRARIHVDKPRNLRRVASAAPDLRLPSQPQGIAAPLDRYHIKLLGDTGTCVNNLPKVVTYKSQGSNPRHYSYKSNAPSITKSGHTVICDGSV